MITWILQILLSALLICAPLPAFAGDIGGGGSLVELQKATHLNANLKAQLLDSGSESQAMQLWLHSLPASKKEVILQKLFNSHILPQLQE